MGAKRKITRPRIRIETRASSSSTESIGGTTRSTKKVQQPVTRLAKTPLTSPEPIVEDKPSPTQSTTQREEYYSAKSEETQFGFDESAKPIDDTLTHLVQRLSPRANQQRTPPIMAQPAEQYQPYTPKVELMEFDNWYEGSEIMQALHAMQRQNFHLQTSRSNMLDILNGLDTQAPFAKAKRFPDGKIYICESSGDWVRKLMQLRIALDFKDPVKDPKATSINTCVFVVD